MNVYVAKTAGFCYGVGRAVEQAFALVRQGTPNLYTFGELIHNREVTRSLEEKGVRVANRVEDIPSGAHVIIRAHGVSQAVTDALKRAGIAFDDMTCPSVQRIQRIAKRTAESGASLLIAGEREHPEVEGIVGYFQCNQADERQNVFIVESAEQCSMLDAAGMFRDIELTIVAQTTFHKDEFLKICQFFAEKHYTNAQIFDTICNTTSARQNEAGQMARQMAAMVVVGGANSANTRRLYDICKRTCAHTVHVESAADLKRENYINIDPIGITAGASTPSGIIEEVRKTMEEWTENMEEQKTNQGIAENLEQAQTAPETAEPAQAAQTNTAEQEEAKELTFEEALEQSLKTIRRGEIVTGTVMAVLPNEVHVDVGAKYTGIIPADEITGNPSDLSKLFQVGDVVEAQIIKTNDVEGTATLSKKRMDAQKAWVTMSEALESGEILAGKVINAVKGGVVVNYEGNRVFIPASQITSDRETDLSKLEGQTVQFKIIEVDRRRRRVIGSVKRALAELRKEAREKILAEIEVGKQYDGVVRSLTSYGAFVDIGGVDGMIHITELSWSKIKHPSAVVNVGDEITVYVKDFDPETGRISLGYKKPEDNPIELFRQKYHVDDIVDAKIVKLMKYGAFAEIIPGVDGLIHISEIAPEHIEKVSDKLKTGDVVTAKIIDIDWDRNRISLSMKAALPESVHETEAGDTDSVVYASDEAEKVTAPVVDEPAIEE